MYIWACVKLKYIPHYSHFKRNNDDEPVDLR